jgi:callose synthase
MTIPMSSELFSGMVRWPIFLLANKVRYLCSKFRSFVLIASFIYKQSSLFLLVFNSTEHCKRFCGEG